MAQKRMDGRPVPESLNRLRIISSVANVPAGFDAPAITLTGIVYNLVPETLGNIVGGAGLVGAMYWMIYRATFGKRNAI